MIGKDGSKTYEVADPPAWDGDKYKEEQDIFFIKYLIYIINILT